MPKATKPANKLLSRGVGPILVVLVLIAASPVSAIDRFWTANASDIRWSSSANWNPFGVPQPVDGVVFNLLHQHPFGTFVDLNASSSLVQLDSFLVSNGRWRFDHENSVPGSVKIEQLQVADNFRVGGFSDIGVDFRAESVAITADALIVGSSFGTAELDLVALEKITADEVNVGTTPGTRGELGIFEGSFLPSQPPILETENMTIGGGLSGRLRVGSSAFQSIRVKVNQHLQVNGSGFVEIAEGTVIVDSATIQGQIDPFTPGSGTRELLVDTQLTWDSPDTIENGLFVSTDTVQQLSPLRLAGGTLQFREINGPAALDWISGTLIDIDDLEVGAATPGLGPSFSVGTDEELIVNGELSVGKTAGGQMNVSSQIPVVSETGVVGGATVDGASANAVFSNGGWDIRGDLTIADDASAFMLITGTAAVRLGVGTGSDPNADIRIGTAYAGGATVNIDSADASLQAADDLIVGNTSGPGGGDVTLSVNRGQATAGGDLILGDETLALVTVINGGTVTATNAQISSLDGVEARVRINGAGSTMDLSGDAWFGGTPTGPRGTGDVVLLDDGALNVAGNAIVYEDYLLNIGGGSFTFSTLDLRGEVDGTGSEVDLTGSGSILNLNGGTFRADKLIVEQPTLAGYGVIDATLQTAGDVVATGDLTLGDPDSFEDILIGGVLDVGTHNVTVLKRGFYVLSNDGLAFGNGGRLTVPNGALLPAGSGLTIAGWINGRIATQSGSVLALEGSLTLGDDTSPAGIAIDGELEVGTNSLTLQDANAADLGTLTTLGDGMGGSGTIIAQNGILLDFGDNLVGYGTVLTPDDPFAPLINNGAIIGNSTAEPVTLHGYVKGVGSLDNVVITGTDAPGFSPATSYRGSVAYQGVVEIELAGTSVGQFDRLIHSGTADLGGTLDVAMLDGFAPVTPSVTVGGAGDQFTVITADTVDGTFNTVTGLDFDNVAETGRELLIDYTGTSVTLTAFQYVAGDTDLNRQVDTFDIQNILIAGKFGIGMSDATWAEGDFDNDGDVDAADIQLILLGGQFDQGVYAAASNLIAIPEPTSLAMLGLGGLLVLRRRG